MRSLPKLLLLHLFVLPGGTSKAITKTLSLAIELSNFPPNNFEVYLKSALRVTLESHSLE